MTYVITSQCIECSRCVSSCPTGAITHHEHRYQINSERCNDCVGHYSVPQCWAVCPTNGGCVSTEAIAVTAQVFSTASSRDYWDAWFDTYNHLVSRLKTSQKSDYWQHWFDTYSQALSRQLHTSTSVGANS